jgi:uncharacterized protein (DUF58 family)
MPSSATANFGFDSAFLQKLERLALLTHRPMVGPGAGPRRSPRHGASVEFADFRDYSPGDDFRRIDWNAYARFERLFLRLYSAEEMTTLTLLLDHSASMRFGEPAKALTAARLAAIFSFLALHHYDRVAVAGWGDRVDRYLPARTGRGNIPLIWKQIGDIMAVTDARTDFSALRSFAGAYPGHGIAIVLSDFLSESDWRGGLRALRGAGKEVTALQILAPEEIDPSVRGDWKLRDAETGAEVEVTISPRLLRRYQDELEAHTAEIREFCRRNGIAFLQIPSSVSIEDTALTSLRAAGVLA